MVTDDLLRVGSWSPELVENGKLNILSSPYSDEYSFCLDSVIIGGREAMFPYGGTPKEKKVSISLDLPYLYVGVEDWIKIITSFHAIAPSIDCGFENNRCRFS